MDHGSSDPIGTEKLTYIFRRKNSECKYKTRVSGLPPSSLRRPQQPGSKVDECICVTRGWGTPKVNEYVFF